MRVKNLIETKGLRDDKIKDRIKCETSLIIRSEGMNPKKYGSLLEAAKNIGVQKQTLEYAYNKGRSLMTRRKGGVKVFFIEWLD